MKLRYIGLAFLILAGCDGGGGSGGNEGMHYALDTGDPGSAQLSMSGVANKGPFAEGSLVRVRRMGDSGDWGRYQTSGPMGEFAAQLREGVGYEFEVTGRYFSEHFGNLTDGEMTLRAVVQGEQGAHANVNLATHLIHERVLALVEDGMSVEEAIQMAEDELKLALGDVIDMPLHPLRFARLAVMNGIQEADNEEGNAWLLAVTSMLERAAVMAHEHSGAGVESELTELCAQIAEDFANDGMIDQALIDELLAARAQIDPDRIHQHLMEFAAEHRAAAIAAATGVSEEEAAQYQCNAFGDEMLCATTTMAFAGSMQQMMTQLGQMSGVRQVRMALRRVVANMNGFIDTDGDGVVNRDDEDDDNDGIPDEEDDTPYGE